MDEIMQIILVESLNILSEKAWKIKNLNWEGFFLQLDSQTTLPKNSSSTEFPFVFGCDMSIGLIVPPSLIIHGVYSISFTTYEWSDDEIEWLWGHMCP